MNRLINAVPSTNGKATKRKTASKRKYSRSEVSRVVAFAAVALCGLGVSLPHLATEVGTLTGANVIAAWFLALVIDAGMVVTKTHLGAGGNNRRVAWALISACTVISMVLNAHAFTCNASTTFGIIMGAVFGLFLPLFIVATSYLATGILSRH